MKKFAIVVSAYLLLLAILVGTLNLVYVQLELPRNEIYKFWSMPEHITICNFGSSHGRKAFCYDDFAPDTSFNFGLTSQKLSYDFRLMQYYADRIDPGADILITISYFSLFGVTDETEQEGFLSKNRRYYRILSDEYIKEYDRRTDIYENLFPALINLDDTVTVLTGQKHDDNQEWFHTAYEIDIEENADLKYQNHIVRGSLDEDGEIAINEAEVTALYDMIDFCREHGWHPYLITPPYTEQYLSRIRDNSPGFLESFDRFVRDIADEKGVPYYNYGQDERFSGDIGLFIDADHMNIDGAKKFTAALMAEIPGLAEEDP